MAEAPQQPKTSPIGLGQDVSIGFNLAPNDFDSAWRVAKAFSSSALVPKPYQGKPEDIIVAWQYGGELGLGLMQSLQSIAVINGKPTLPGETLLALAINSGEMEEFEETWDEQAKTATCLVKRRGRKPITHSFSWADAERIKTFEHGQQVTLSSKDTYKNYPRRMCTMRARGFALKDSFADLYKGFKSTEEAEEIVDHEPRTVSAELSKSELAKKQTEAQVEPEPIVAAAPPPVEEKPEVIVAQTVVAEAEAKKEPERFDNANPKAGLLKLIANTQASEESFRETLHMVHTKVSAIPDEKDQLEVINALNMRKRELFEKK